MAHGRTGDRLCVYGTEAALLRADEIIIVRIAYSRDSRDRAGSALLKRLTLILFFLIVPICALSFGRSAPAQRSEREPKWGKPISLFNGKDFTGWEFDDPSLAGSWKVVQGILVSSGRGANLMTARKFGDFKLHLEFNCAPKSNSGVYVRDRFADVKWLEVQIETDSEQEPPSHHTGAVYGLLASSPELPRRAGEWQTFDITLVGRTITVVENGQTVIDQQVIPGTKGAAGDTHEVPGPIYLQGSEDGRVAFRNIVVTPAEESLTGFGFDNAPGPMSPQH